MPEFSRRKLLGLMAGGAGGSALVACSTPGTAATGRMKYAETFVRFDHGVASGDATDRAVILWTRVTPETETAGPVPVRCFLTTDRAALDGVSEKTTQAVFDGGRVVDLTTSASRDYTVKLDAGADLPLKPATTYFYRFGVMTPNGMVLSPAGTTQTRASGDMDRLTLGVVSCSNFPFGYFNAYGALAKRDDLDAVVHLGDYLYEYGVDGYGGSVGQQIGRVSTPVTEIVSLEDYRTRHAQYKSDPDLQAAHAAHGWYCTWDDHESTNNSYRNGAENHNPEENEGDWTERKQVAVQAYLEWMPVRDPAPGRARESIYRSFRFGNLASLHCLESRLTGRSDEIDWATELAGVEPAQIPAKAGEVMARVADPSRTMLGDVQEKWLAKDLAASVKDGVAWQVLANQVIMAKVKAPNLQEELTAQEIADIKVPQVGMLVGFSQLGLPWNLDAWDGFPAARARLYADAKAAGASLVTLTGDTHTAWANDLHGSDGTVLGAEFGCTSITSPGLGTYLPIERMGQLFAEANEEVAWHDPFGQGFTVVTFTKDAARASFVKVSTVLETDYTSEEVAQFESRKTSAGLSTLVAV